MRTSYTPIRGISSDNGYQELELKIICVVSKKELQQTGSQQQYGIIEKEGERTEII